ncbi:hypothetical protein ACJX0J_009000 [Zea mays]
MEEQIGEAHIKQKHPFLQTLPLNHIPADDMPNGFFKDLLTASRGLNNPYGSVAVMDDYAAVGSVRIFLQTLAFQNIASTFLLLNVVTVMHKDKNIILFWSLIYVSSLFEAVCLFFIRFKLKPTI